MAGDHNLGEIWELLGIAEDPKPDEYKLSYALLWLKEAHPERVPQLIAGEDVDDPMIRLIQRALCLEAYYQHFEGIRREIGDELRRNPSAKDRDSLRKEFLRRHGLAPPKGRSETDLRQRNTGIAYQEILMDLDPASMVGFMKGEIDQKSFPNDAMLEAARQVMQGEGRSTDADNPRKAIRGTSRFGRFPVPRSDEPRKRAPAKTKRGSGTASARNS